ncbi:DUF4293 family protein [Blattabacterium sp. (Nauphoeta cinerea)]|uniref:DUF4293 family protein n=1 Tax=Blattabacterium sp. (Nauphoeta cinerea) TaxID=1316444 RepID=UPI0009DC04A3|nr:DUF4293 family protein [Blattabacterium sp. (Nauphoeta cinerea)]
MLYRIQTLYLLISIFIYSILIYFFKFKNITDFSNFYLNKIILIFLIICLFLSILSLFFFKKQKLQIFFNKINILANTIYVFIFFFSYFQLNKYTFIVFLFFILCIYILYLTNRAIKKDIELIDSINRIR